MYDTTDTAKDLLESFIWLTEYLPRDNVISFVVVSF